MPVSERLRLWELDLPAFGLSLLSLLLLILH
jgi:hypothetical protein